MRNDLSKNTLKMVVRYLVYIPKVCTDWQSPPIKIMWMVKYGMVTFVTVLYVAHIDQDLWHTYWFQHILAYNYSSFVA